MVASFESGRDLEELSESLRVTSSEPFERDRYGTTIAEDGSTCKEPAGQGAGAGSRILPPETGQVVAVATTKIVKDDSIKSMLAKRTAAAGGSESCWL